MRRIQKNLPLLEREIFFFIQQELNALAELFAPLFAEFCKAAFIECLANFHHQVVIEPQVVHNRQALSQHFAGLEQMTDICAAVILTTGQ